MNKHYACNVYKELLVNLRPDSMELKEWESLQRNSALWSVLQSRDTVYSFVWRILLNV